MARLTRTVTVIEAADRGTEPKSWPDEFSPAVPDPPSLLRAEAVGRALAEDSGAPTYVPGCGVGPSLKVAAREAAERDDSTDTDDSEAADEEAMEATDAEKAESSEAETAESWEEGRMSAVDTAATRVEGVAKIFSLADEAETLCRV